MSSPKHPHYVINSAQISDSQRAWAHNQRDLLLPEKINSIHFFAAVGTSDAPFGFCMCIFHFGVQLQPFDICRFGISRCGSFSATKSKLQFIFLIYARVFQGFS